MSDEILVAKESFSTEINGTPRVVTKGETFREGHPVIEGREEMFESFKVDNELETATAEPGKRRRGRGKSSAEVQKTAEAEQDQTAEDEAKQARTSQETDAEKAVTEKKATAEPGK